MNLQDVIHNITPPNEAARAAARARWNACAKPLGSLGLMESAIEDVAALTGDADVDLSEKAVLVLCADNGVVRQGVTQTDSGVTAVVARQLALGRTSVCRMAEVARCRVVPVDSCLLEDRKADEIIVTIRRMLRSFKIAAYDEDSGRGVLRHVARHKLQHLILRELLQVFLRNGLFYLSLQCRPSFKDTLHHYGIVFFSVSTF